jgi:hypothetical protein
MSGNCGFFDIHTASGQNVERFGGIWNVDLKKGERL